MKKLNSFDWQVVKMVITGNISRGAILVMCEHSRHFALDIIRQYGENPFDAIKRDQINVGDFLAKMNLPIPVIY